MAKAELLKPFILKWEGGYVNDKYDKGGATNKGVTIATFRMYGKDNDGDGDIDENDLKLITDSEWMVIFKRFYWDRWKADQIRSQSVANILVDWLWASGSYAIKIPQTNLGLTSDGIVGAKTIAKINSMDAKMLFLKIKEWRLRYIDSICASHPKWKVKYEHGWKRRIDALSFTD